MTAGTSGYDHGVSGTLVVNEVYLSLQGESTFAGLPCIFVRLTACNLRCSYCDTAYAFTEGTRREVVDVRAEIERLADTYSSPGRSRAHLEYAMDVGRPPSGGDQATPAEGSGPTTATTNSGCTRKSSVFPVVPDLGIPARHRLPLVEFTGGEPLLQPRAAALMRELCDAGFTVLVETSGAHDIGVLDPRVRRIMDLKSPSSGEVGRNRWANIPLLRGTDEVKFVLGTWEDYEWMRQVLAEHSVATICPVLVSWVAPLEPHQRDPSLKPVPAGHRPITRRELVDRIIEDRLPVRFQLQMHKYVWSPDARGV